MRVAVLCALFVVALTLPAITANSPAAKPEDVGLSSERLQRITKMIERRIAAGQLAGAVTIVGRRGKVAHHVAQGVMDRDSKQPMTAGSMFRIASMTKPVIGVAVMMLVEEGKLHLNDPVARYIPEFRDMKVAVPLPAGPARRQRRRGRGAPRFYTVPAQRADHHQGPADAHVRPRQRPDEHERDREGGAQGRRDAGRLHPAAGPHGARVPAGLALGLQPRRRIRDAGPRDRDRVGRARSTASSAHASSIRWA